MFDCVVEKCGRSGVVSFGDGVFRMVRSAIVGSKIHGVCARGRTLVRISQGSIIDESGVRGAYGECEWAKYAVILY